MNEGIKIEVYLTKVDPSIAYLIQSAIETKQYFGLASSATIYVFDVNVLKSYFINKSGGIGATMQYPDLRRFLEGVSIQLLTHRTCVKGNKIISYMVEKALPLPPFKLINGG